jgi:hypothetical protein
MTQPGRSLQSSGRGQSFAVIPWQMAIVARLLRVMPDWLYDSLASRAQRKPRRSA